MLKKYPLLLLFVIYFTSLYAENEGKGNALPTINPAESKTMDNPAVGVIEAILLTCHGITAPWSENFDGVDWISGTGPTNTGNQVSSCWSRPSVNNPNFGTGMGTTFSINTGPDNDYSGTGNYLYTEATSAPGTGEITSPTIFLPTSMSNVQLSFWYHMYGADINYLDVEISNGGAFTNILTINGEQQSSNSDPWKEASVNLTAYIGDSVQIRFIGSNNNSFRADIAIDEVSIDSVSCPAPTNLQAANFTTTSLDLSWISGGSSDWQIRYRPVGSASYTTVSTSVNPFALTGLTANTEYEISVRDSCGTGDVSEWTGLVNATTLCGVSTAPFFENFDGAEWITGTGATNSGSVISNCWTRPSGINPDFSVGTGPSPSFNTGPTSDVSGSGNYIYTEASNGAFGTGEILSPRIYIPSGLTTAGLSFEYHLYGADITSLVISVDNGSGFSQVGNLNGQQQTSNAAPWLTSFLDLSSYIGDTIQIRFAGTNTGFSGDIAIDEIRVDTNICLPSDSIWSIAQGIDSVVLDWIPNTASNWLIEYGPSGFTPGTGTVITASTRPFTITGLAPNTEYCFFLRDSCGPGSISHSINTCAITDCPQYVVPWSENFDDTNDWMPGTLGFNTGNEISRCWSRPSAGNPNFGTWSGATGSDNTGPNSDLSGSGNYIYTEASGAVGTGGITSPELILPALLGNVELKFWYHMYGIAIGSLEVEVSNGGAFTNIFTINGQQQTSSADAWRKASVDLSSYLGDTIQVRFKGSNTAFQGDIAIDEVSIDSVSCSVPTNLQVSSPTTSTLDLTWVSGGASQWQIRYRPVGTGPYTIIPASTNPFVLTSLSPGTTYEIAVRDSCGAGDVSEWTIATDTSTICATYSIPWSENFDGPTWAAGTGADNVQNVIFSCWSRPGSNNPNFGTRSGATGSNNTGPDNDLSGIGNYIYTEASGATGTGEITTPSIFLSPLVSNPELNFWYHMFGQAITSLEVEISNGGSFTNILTINGQQQASGAEAWRKAGVDLSSYLGDTVQIRFKGSNTGFQGDIAIDEVSIDSVSCPVPTNLQVTNASTTSLDLSWNSGGASEWQIRYRPLGASSYTLISASTNPFVLTSLIQGTTYEISVRDSCGAGDVSAWTIPVDTSTICGVYSIPWSENFDAPPWTAGTGADNVQNIISTCWSRPGSNNPNFGTGSGATVSNNTGPDSDFSGSGNYLYTEASGGTGTGEITTPFIFLSPSVSNPELSFWYHMFGQAITSLEVEVSNGGGFTNVYTLNGQQQTSNADPWQEAHVNLSSYTGDTIQIRFKGSNTAFPGDIAIDEISIDSVSCSVPTNVQAANVTSTSMDLSWTTGGASDWQIRYRPVGTSSYTIVSVSANPFVLTSLAPGTSYEISVRDSCGAGDVSEWTANVDTITPCSLVSAPWNENFDGSEWIQGAAITNNGNVISPCWSRPSAANPNFGPWSGATGSANTGPDTDLSGSGNFIYTEASGAGGTGEITSPNIIIPTSVNNPHLSFWYHMHGVDIGSLEVEISSGGTFTNIFTLNGEQQTAGNDPWLKAAINLSAYSGDTIQLRFKGTNTGNFRSDIAIDEVSVDSVACPAPDSLLIVSTTTTSIDLSWITGGATEWQIRYRPVGTGSYTIVSASANSFTLTSLSPGTQYEISVRDSCGPGDVSDWTALVNAVTSCTVITAPWTENFEGSSWVPGTGIPNAGDEIDACWFRATNTGVRWTTGTGATASNQTGPSDDYSTGGKYLYVEASIGNATPQIETPWIYLPANLSQPALEYYYHMYGQGITSLTVEVDNGSGYQLLQTISGQQQTYSADAWIKDSLGLNTYSEDTLRFRFSGSYTNFMGDISIDEVSVNGNLNPCMDPSQVSFTATDPTSATLSWVSSSGNTQIEVVESGQPQGSGTTYSPVTPPFTIPNLMANTTYDVYIRDSCGSFFSNWIDTSFTTDPCPAVVAAFNTQDNYLQVNFDASATSNADTLIWLFGDGNGGSGNVTSHSYAAPGTFQVSLIGVNDCGNSDTLTQSIEVCDTLTADFDLSSSGDTVFLDASASSGVSVYHWNLGSGIDTTGAILYYVFSSSGYKTISLTVVNACGDSISITKNIQMCVPPVADWTYTVLGTTGNGMQVQFDGSASKNAVSYEWDFGDGNTATGAVQPLHTYVTPGLFYIVKLTVTNNCGDKNTMRYRLSQIGLAETDILAGIELYPNPADELVKLEWPANDLSVQAIEILEVSGKLILQQDIDKNENGGCELNISRLSSGYFLLRIKSDKGIIEKQLIVR